MKMPVILRRVAIHFAATAAAAIAAGAAWSADDARPTRDRIAEATAQCSAAVDSHCLITLAVDAALAAGDEDLLLNRIAETQIRLGDTEGARRTLTLTEPRSNVLLLLGEWDAAYQKASEGFARRIVEHGTPEGSFKGRMAIEQARQGNVDLALGTITEIGERFNERARAEVLVVRVLVADGDLGMAHEIAGRIAPPYRAEALRRVVTAQIAAGDADGATATAGMIEDGWALSEAMVEIAHARIAAGQNEAAAWALAVATDAASGWSNRFHGGTDPRLFVPIARAFADAGSTDLARQAADRAMDVFEDKMRRRRNMFTPLGRIGMSGAREHDPLGPHDVAMLASIALVLIETGSTRRGTRALDEAQAALADDRTRSDLAEAAAEVMFTKLVAGDPTTARGALERLLEAAEASHPALDASVLVRIGTGLVARGRLDDALMLARRIERREYSGRVASRIYQPLISELLRQGDINRARVIATTIPTGTSRFGNTIAFARHLHDLGRPGEAQQLLADLGRSLAERAVEHAYEWEEIVGQLLTLAKAQSKLGDSGEAARLRQIAFSRIASMDQDFRRVAAYLRIASSLADCSDAAPRPLPRVCEPPI